MKKLILPALAASGFANLFLMYGLLDRALLADDLGQTVTHASQKESILQKMLPRLLANTTREELISTANALQLEVMEEPGVSACVDGVCFRYTDGRVTGVFFQM